MKKRYALLLLLAWISCLPLGAQSSWHPLSSGLSAPVGALAVDTTAHKVYAGGLFLQAGALPAAGIAQWDGGKWSPLGLGSITGLGVSAILADSGGVIAAGTFSSIGGILVNNIGVWNGLTWLPMGAGLDYTGATTVSTLTRFKGQVYAGGHFIKSNGTLLNNIARWDGSQWQPLGTGVNGTVLALEVFQGELYASGQFTLAGGVPVKNIARWNGQSWSDVGGGLDYTGATTVSSMRKYNNSLYAGGTFSKAGSAAVSNLAAWDGTQWASAGGGVKAGALLTASVAALTVYKNQLAVAGSYSSSGGISTSNISLWNGSSWTALSTGTNSTVSALAALDDSLYAGGLFTFAGNQFIPFVAKWSPTRAPNTLITAVAGTLFGSPSVKAYPNPTTSLLLVELGEVSLKAPVELTVYDLSGKLLLRQTTGDSYTVLDLSAQAPGLYLLKIMQGGQVFSVLRLEHN
jgi:hypothetical protein